MQPVKSASVVMELMDTGLRNRAVGATALNERSSRSHSVVTLHVGGRDLKIGAAFHGNLYLVDLAGSERVDCSEVTGDRLREAQHINKSLSALGDVKRAPMYLTEIASSLNSYKALWVASLKETIAKKDGEIERLQVLKDLKNVHPGINGEKHGTPQQSQKGTGGKGFVTEKSVADHDNCSELKHSEADSQQSMDDLKCQNELLRQLKVTGGDIGADGSAENAGGRKLSDHLEN